MPEYGGLPITTVKRLPRLTSFTAAASWASASKPISGGWLRRRFQGVGEVDANSLLRFEAIAGLSELQADLHVGDGVRGHQQFVAVEPREQMSGT